MKILIVRPWPSVLDVTKNTYNIQEVGLAKALVKRGHPTDILFWTDGDEMTVKVEVEGAKPINVFYRHGKVLLKNVWFKGRRSSLPSMMCCRPPSITRCSRGIWREIPRKDGGLPRPLLLALQQEL